MKSYLKNSFGMTAVIFCSMILTQVVTAQSGSRVNEYQAQQTLPAQAQTYGTPRGLSREIAGSSFDQYDHRAWDSLLQKYVDQSGNVDYASWQANGQDRATLLDYLRGMSSVNTSVTSDRQSEMAFWINAYNALTIEGILQVFPTNSIKDHAPDANGFNIWDDFKLPVGGSEYSLNDIEHKVLRKMGDPRIHFAIVCASKSCPQLSQRAYFADSLEQHLAYSTGLFFRTPGKFSYDLQRGELGLSPIIKWFGEDFGRSEQERLQYLAQFMPEDAGRLAASGSATIKYLDYDWGLNLAPRQNAVAVTNLRPQAQGSATRQSEQLPPSQNLPSQGSTIRGQFESYQPVQTQRRSGPSSCRSQAVYDYRTNGQ